LALNELGRCSCLLQSDIVIWLDNPSSFGSSRIQTCSGGLAIEPQRAPCSRGDRKPSHPLISQASSIWTPRLREGCDLELPSLAAAQNWSATGASNAFRLCTSARRCPPPPRKEAGRTHGTLVAHTRRRPKEPRHHRSGAFCEERGTRPLSPDARCRNSHPGMSDLLRCHLPEVLLREFGVHEPACSRPNMQAEACPPVCFGAVSHWQASKVSLILGPRLLPPCHLQSARR
jgi:hypothetical protein